ncbi:CPBP family glutamic-type intramembrane protease [Agrobacterium pusense]|uniref:CPBP family glutamic-type intramembrane protease n=1 Tax=Agrobacterium pusense TaxID=648995 RepID=UPI003D0F3D72
MGHDVVFRVGSLALYRRRAGSSVHNVRRYRDPAALFAAGHLPFLFTIAAQPRPALVLAVLTGNFVPGLIFGWLFWRRGLEAAILSHGFAHCINTLVA